MQLSVMLNTLRHIISQTTVFVIAVSQEKGKPALLTFVKYARVELVPPRFSELPQVRKGFGDLLTAVRTQKWRDATVKVAVVLLSNVT